MDTRNLDEDLLSSLIYLTQCIIIVYDIQKEATYQSALKIYKTISSIFENKVYLTVFLLGNKQDLENFVIDNDFQSEVNKGITMHNLTISTVKKYNISKVKSLLYTICTTQKTPKNQVLPAPDNISEDELNNFIIVLLGDSTVGKTSFFHRFFDGDFNANYASTIGMVDKTKVIQINHRCFKFQLWDTAGQERFRAIPSKYYDRANGIILLYDITKEETFLNIESWMRNINEKSSEFVKIFLVGNKADLSSGRVVSSERGKKFAQSKGISFCEVSCKWDLNISDVMYDMVYQIYQSNKYNDDVESPSICISQKKKKIRQCCG